MKRKSYYCFPVLLMFLTAFAATTVSAGEYTSYYHVQAMLGRMTIDEGACLFEGAAEADDSYRFEENRVDIPMLGVSVQQMLGGDRFEFGVEGGGLFSWKTDRWQILLSNGTANIRIESSTFLADLFFGGFAARNVGERVRLYLGAGPLLIYGQQKIDPDYPEIEPYIYYPKKTESDWDVGLYTRAGIEFRFTDELIAGLGVRWMRTQLDFNNPGGKTKVEGIQVLFTLAATLYR